MFICFMYFKKQEKRERSNALSRITPLRGSMQSPGKPYRLLAELPMDWNEFKFQLQ